MAIKHCGTCEFGQTRPDDLTIVDCYGVPPSPVMVPVGPGQMKMHFARPMMKKNELGCGLHKLKLLVTSNDVSVSE